MQKHHRHRSRREWEKILKAWKQSKLTGPEFANQYGLNHLSLYRWSTKLGSGKSQDDCRKSEPFTQNKAPEEAKSSPFALRIVPVPEHLLSPVDEAPRPRKVPSLSLVIGRRFRVVVPDGFSPGTLGKLIQTLEAL